MIIEQLSEQEAERLLDDLNLRADPDTLTPEELAQTQGTATEMQRGTYVTLDALERDIGLPSSAS
ncbi:MAG: hypothetical protein ACYDCQ_05765 [Dehalococcoidia bacterium]